MSKPSNKTVMKKLQAFLLGIREFRSDVTTNLDSAYGHNYDKGRDFAHQITMRKWDI